MQPGALASRLLLFAGKHWLRISFTAGFLVFLLSVVGTIVTVNRIQIDRVRGEQKAILALGDQIITEQTETLWILKYLRHAMTVL